MASIRNKFGEPRYVPGYGEVDADAVLEVPDDELPGFTCQEGWIPVGSASEALHEAAEPAERPVDG